MRADRPGNELPEHPSEAMYPEHTDKDEHVGVIGNERLTAVGGLVFLLRRAGWLA